MTFSMPTCFIVAHLVMVMEVDILAMVGPVLAVNQHKMLGVLSATVLRLL